MKNDNKIDILEYENIEIIDDKNFIEKIKKALRKLKNLICIFHRLRLLRKIFRMHKSQNSECCMMLSPFLK